MQPFLMLQKIPWRFFTSSLSLSRACTHFKSDNTSPCTTSDEEQLYSLHTHRCTKVFSPRKAAGEIDLIWLFSMNLKRTKKKKKKKEVSNTSTRTKTGGACVTFQRQDALLLTGTRDEEDQGTRPRLWTPGCWPWRGCAGERSVTFHHRITTSWCPTLAAVYWKRWTCDRKPPASFPTTAAQLHQTQGSTLC